MLDKKNPIEKKKESLQNSAEFFAQFMNDLNNLKSEMRNTSTSANSMSSRVLELFNKYSHIEIFKGIFDSLISDARTRDAKIFKNQIILKDNYDNEMYNAAIIEQERIDKIERAKYLAYKALNKDLKEGLKYEANALNTIAKRIQEGHLLSDEELDHSLKKVNQLNNQLANRSEYGKELNSMVEEIEKQEKVLHEIIQDPKKLDTEKTLAHENKTKLLLAKKIHTKKLEQFNKDTKELKKLHLNHREQINKILDVANNLPDNHPNKEKLLQFNALKEIDLNVSEGLTKPIKEFKDNPDQEKHSKAAIAIVQQLKKHSKVNFVEKTAHISSTPSVKGKNSKQNSSVSK